MAFVTANDVTALIQEDVAQDIISDVSGRGSQILPLFTQLPQMSSKQTRVRVLSALPTAYFVDSPSESTAPGTKQTSRVAWDKVFITAEELAVIVPIPEELLDDAEYDIWSQVKPALAEAFGVAIDTAVIHDTGAPASWPDGLVTQATNANNVVAVGAGTDIYDDILSEDGLFALVENDGYIVRDAVGAIPLKASLRGLRSTVEGLPIFKREGVQGATVYTIDGVPIQFPTHGVPDPDEALLIAGDFSRFVYAIRRDITYKVLTEAMVPDGNGGFYNLAAQDMVALRAVMRLGWAAPNPANRVEPTATDRCPVGVLVPADGSGS